MAGFFRGIGRFLNGQPVFQANDAAGDASQQQSTQPAVQSQPANPAASAADKPLPFINIRRWEHEYHGSSLQVNLTFHNTSQETLDLDHILFLGQKTEFDEILEPGEMHELKAYYGSPLEHDAYAKVELWYKDENRTLFCSLYLLEYHINRRGQYEITRFRFEPPVRKYR